MENKLAKGFYVSKGNVDWKPAVVGCKIDEAIAELQRGFVNLDICISKDGTKLYPTWNLYNAKQEQVSASQHSPDRDDLPF